MDRFEKLAAGGQYPAFYAYAQSHRCAENLDFLAAVSKMRREKRTVWQQKMRMGILYAFFRGEELNVSEGARKAALGYDMTFEVAYSEVMGMVFNGMWQDFVLMNRKVSQSN